MIGFPLLFLLGYFHTMPLQDAAEIVKRADANLRGNTCKAEVTILTIRPSWQREMQVRIWSKGKSRAMILIRQPARDKGIAYLKRNNEVWTWMPSLERTIKLPPSMMSQSWMGTDFTNDDLVRESSLTDDYEHSLIGDTVIAGRSCYRIQMIPRAETAVVWSKLIACIDKKDYLELQMVFFDEKNIPVSIMRASEVKRMDNRLIPTRFEMIPADKPGHKTVMTYTALTYDRPMEDAFFSMENMKAAGE
jgi:hypothetical protein